MIVLSNTTPLIGLASIGRFDLLRQMFGELTIAHPYTLKLCLLAGKKAAPSAKSPAPGSKR